MTHKSIRYCKIALKELLKEAILRNLYLILTSILIPNPVPKSSTKMNFYIFQLFYRVVVHWMTFWGWLSTVLKFLKSVPKCPFFSTLFALKPFFDFNVHSPTKCFCFFLPLSQKFKMDGILILTFQQWDSWMFFLFQAFERKKGKKKMIFILWGYFF